MDHGKIFLQIDSMFWVSFEYIGGKKTFIFRVTVRDEIEISQKLWMHIKMGNKNKERDEKEGALYEVIKRSWHTPVVYSYDLQLDHGYHGVMHNAKALDISGQVFQDLKLRF